MAPSKVIRIDEQVWAELQKRAMPLEDTPNSVLRRVFGLPEGALDAGSMDSRVDMLLGLVQELVGEMPQMCREKRNYSFLSQNEEVVAYIRAQREKLRIGVSKEIANAAGLTGWDRERPDSFFGGNSVRWYIPDGDESAYRKVAGLLEKLLKLNAKS